MLLAMRFAWIIALCILLAGCSFYGKPSTIDVTPDIGSGAVEGKFSPPTVVRYSDTPTRIGFEPVPLKGGDFKTIMDFVFLPEGKEFLAINRLGLIGYFSLYDDHATLIDSFTIPAVYTGGDCAATSITLDPAFESNKLFYVHYCLDEQFSAIKRYTMSDEDFSETVYSAANVLATGDPKSDIPRRAIGQIMFGPDGALWANIGDRGRSENAQNLSTELGKIIRLKPLRESNISGFTVPDRNMPRDSVAGLNPLVYAYGFQYPRRGAFDSLGRYWVADVGSSNFEEINIVSRPGQNFGWPRSEGVTCKTGSCATYVPPTLYWDHSSEHRFILEDPLSKEDSEFRAAWVGIEYLPGKQDRYNGLLSNRMLYGDFYMGFVRGAVVSSKGVVVDDKYLGHIDLPVAWRQNADGYVYVATMYKSFDRSKEFQGDGNLVSQVKQGGLWRVVPLP